MDPSPGFLALSDRDLAGLGIKPEEVADAVESALYDKANGILHVAPKSALLPGDGRYMMATLSVGDRNDMTVVKSVTVSPDNTNRGLPAINGAILVMDARSGLLRAVLGANWITGVRTAALSAIAARRLAHPEAGIIAFVGCGLQARTHLEAFRSEFPLREVRGIGRTVSKVEEFCAEVRSTGLEAVVAEDIETALRDADIVVSSITLDYSVEPFIDARILKPGAFAAITDLAIPWQPDGMTAFGTLVVDDLEQEQTAERPMVPPDRIACDLTQLVCGPEVTIDRSQPSAFAFRGIALGDYAAAALALNKARELKKGTLVAND